MSDATPPPDDEIVSAHLDGEASADEAAMVRADAELEARAAELARVRAAVATPVDPPAAAREAAIAAALDVFDQEVAPTIALGAAGSAGAHRDGRAPEGVTDLTARRAEAGRRAARNGRILAVAAAVVVVLLGAATVVRVVSGQSQDQLTAVTQSGGASPGTAGRSLEAADSGKQSDGSGSGDSSAGEVPAANAPPTATRGAGDPTTTVTGPPPTTAPTTAQDDTAFEAQAYGYRGADLGSVSNADQLRAATLTAIADQATQQQTSDAAGAPLPPVSPESVSLAALTDELATCDAVLHSADREIGPAAFSAVAQYQGTNALVFVYPIDRRQFPAANGATRIYAVDRATCRVLDSQTP